MVNAVRRVFATRSVGHMGTLDPAASGVLPMAVGKATRLIPYVEGEDKTYRAEICFGLATDTEDMQGKILARQDVSAVSESDLRRVLPDFVGTIKQVPPMFSALKIDGKRLYQLAREGKEVDRAPRTITITSLDLLSFAKETDRAVALIRVRCSRGTYVRSLCRDIGAAMGVPACMGFLLRESSGPFHLDDSVTLPELRERPLLIPSLYMFPAQSRLSVDVPTAVRFVQGQPSQVQAENGEYAVATGDIMLGIASVRGEILSPSKVIVERSDLPIDCN